MGMAKQNCKDCKWYDTCGYSICIKGENKCLDFREATNRLAIPCKECKHYMWDDFDGCYVCMKLSKYVKPDFWCAYGKERENEHN